MKEDYQNALKKVTSIFLSKPVPFNKQIYQKQKGPGTSYQSLKNFIISHVLSDQVWWYNIKGFLSYSKITSANLCKPIYDIINYSTSICPFVSGQCGKEGKNYKNLDISRKKRAFKMK